MASITVDNDIRDALNAGRITWPEAGELRDLRKSTGKVAKKVERLQDEIDTLKAETNGAAERMAVLEAKVKEPETSE